MSGINSVIGLRISSPVGGFSSSGALMPGSSPQSTEVSVSVPVPGCTPVSVPAPGLALTHD